MSELLKLVNITKKFPGVLALSNVNLEVKKGEVHALLGENGAGKSTLMKILTGVYQKDSGKIIFEGKEVAIDNPRKSQDLGISMIYQEINLIPYLSVAENIFLGREPLSSLGKINWSKMYSDTKKILSELEIDISPKTLIVDLGIAQQQMIEIAKAIYFNAKLIIMDEPTSALTEREIKTLFNIIKKLKTRSIGVIYISHRLEEIREIADKVTVLRDGKYIGTDKIQNLNEGKIIQMMVGRELKEKFPKEYYEAEKQEALKVVNLTRKGVFKDITFTAYKGEVLGIYGLVGAGRTEIARAIFGVDPIDRGEIYIYGEKAIVNKPYDAVKSGLGLLPEDRKLDGLILCLGVDKNITIANIDEFTSKGKINKSKERKVVKNFITSLGIKTPSHFQQVKFLSGGNQQKVVLAKWLCTNSKIVIFDEPTRGIDVGAKIEVYQLINKMVKQGKTIIMISSEMPEILGMSDRILVISNGHITAELNQEDATQEKILKLAMA